MLSISVSLPLHKLKFERGVESYDDDDDDESVRQLSHDDGDEIKKQINKRK